MELEKFKSETKKKLQVNFIHDEFEDISKFNVKIEGMKIDIGIIWNNMLVDEFNLCWNNFIIEGCYRKWAKDLMYQNQQLMHWILKLELLESKILLPTYEVLYQRKVYETSSEECVSCNEETEAWDHIRKCMKNKFVLFDLWRCS
ncbi:hypothetical protein RhiirA4_476671 [Rhizophagus irregularis]|uniref:Uncharacterized protein n=1 Tax=Rhizophagus irregularis TaxID=588596 RepID=A0A2I1HC47_9GLOM|nr:hypothetical protein RhiirA4_476671 [Rhizophagus irregularis]